MLACQFESPLLFQLFGYFKKGDNNPIDLVVGIKVRFYFDNIIMATILCGHFTRKCRQVFRWLREVVLEVGVIKVRHKIKDGAPNIPVLNAKEILAARREEFEQTLAINKHDRHINAFDQVSEIVVCNTKRCVLGCQFRIRDCEIGIDRVQFFSRAFKLLVGTLEFLVDCQQFFVACPKFLLCHLEITLADQKPLSCHRQLGFIDRFNRIDRRR